MHWRDEYERKVTTAKKAMFHISKGQRVFVGTGCGEPQELVRALIDHADSMADNEIINTLSFGLAPYAEEKFGDQFRLNTFFIGPNVREAVNEGRADYTPIHLSEIASLIESGRIPIDVALIQVSPPDLHGFCSFGISVDITKPATEAAKVVIAEMNRQMPRTLGDCFIHISEIDHIVETDYLIGQTFEAEDADEVIEDIGRHVASLIENGSTIQIGFGDVPDAVLKYLEDKKDLGVHTEMFSDGLIDLVEKGVITGKKKSIHPEKIIASFCMGSDRLMEFVGNNPMIEFHPSSYTNNPCLIGRNHKMTAINTALTIDLTGQVCADQAGYTFYTGLGGQVDFMRGAAYSKGGKPIIAMPSTARNGTISRIQPHIPEGAGVTTTRGDVHYVVTEYGVAYLHGKSIMQRALELINIAHPKFRKWLLEAAKYYGYVYTDQSSEPYRGRPYPEEYEAWEQLGDEWIFFRPIKPTDEDMMKDLFYSFSEKTVYQRFMGFKPNLPHRERMRLVNIDYDSQMAIGAYLKKGEALQLVAMSRYMVDKKSNTAEVSFAVRDDWQCKGIGTHLLNSLIRIGRERGIKAFTAEVLSTNIRMLNLFYRTGLNVQTTLQDGTYQVHFELFAPKPDKNEAKKAVLNVPST